MFTIFFSTKRENYLFETLKDTHTTKEKKKIEYTRTNWMLIKLHWFMEIWYSRLGKHKLLRLEHAQTAFFSSNKRFVPTIYYLLYKSKLMYYVNWDIFVWDVFTRLYLNLTAFTSNRRLDYYVAIYGVILLCYVWHYVCFIYSKQSSDLLLL